ncbi:MAG: hypothetical protein H6733_00565 [Alphaproteobacteria bacterium]|nr:hypothetical protein [Alphaproteobacteria bacterium]
MDDRTPPTPDGALHPASPWWFAASAVALVATWMGLAWQRFPLVNHDVAAVTGVSIRMLDGERLYTDLPQPNPPLVFVMQELPVALARALGVPLLPTVLVFLTACVLGCWALTVAVSRAVQLPGDAGARHLVLLGLLVLLTAFTGYDMGQREHLIIASMAPLLWAQAGAVAGRPLGRGLGLAVGVVAGLGLAIKPFYPPVWVLLELWVLARTRRWRALLRPENVGVVGVLAVYGVWVIGFTGYLDNLPLWLDSYTPYGALGMPFQAVVNATHPWTLVGVLAAWAVLRLALRLPGVRPLDEAVALTIVPFAAAVVVQGKGFAYQALPAFVAAGWLVVLLVVGTLGRWRPLAPLSWVALLALAWPVYDGDDANAWRHGGVLWPGTYPCIPQADRKQARSDNRCDVRAVVAQVDALTEPGDAIAWVSPTVLQAGYVQTMVPVRDVVRVTPMLLPDLYTRAERRADPFPYHDDSTRPAAEARVMTGLADDLLRTDPVLVVFDVRRNLRGFDRTVFSLVTFARQDPRTATLLDTRYTEVDDVSGEGTLRWFLRNDRVAAAP